MRGIGSMLGYWTPDEARGGPLVPKSFPEPARRQKGFCLQFVRPNRSFISCCCAGSIGVEHSAEGLDSTGGLSVSVCGCQKSTPTDKTPTPDPSEARFFSRHPSSYSQTCRSGIHGAGFL